jgi:hypothetical protein
MPELVKFWSHYYYYHYHQASLITWACTCFTLSMLYFTQMSMVKHKVVSEKISPPEGSKFSFIGILWLTCQTVWNDAGWPDWTNFRLTGEFIHASPFLVDQIIKLIIHRISYALILTKFWLIFFTKSSGHPGNEGFGKKLAINRQENPFVKKTLCIC